MSRTVISEAEVTEKVIDAIVEVCPDLNREDVNAATSFEAIEVDSIDMVEVAQILADEYAVKIPGEELDEITTVGAAAAFIHQRL